MRKILLVVIISLSALLTSNYAAAGNAMPLTKQNLLTAAFKMKSAIENIDSEDKARVKDDAEYAKQLIVYLIVDPITETAPGADFDETVYQIASLVGTNREPVDNEYRFALRFLFTSIYKSSRHLMVYGFISEETKVVLDETLKRF